MRIEWYEGDNRCPSIKRFPDRDPVQCTRPRHLGDGHESLYIGRVWTDPLDCTHINATSGICPDCGEAGTWTPVTLPRYLSAIVDDSPCDGSHGRFCPECASINRSRDNHPAGRSRK